MFDERLTNAPAEPSGDEIRTYRDGLADNGMRHGDHEAAAVGLLDLENVASAEILDRGDGADGRAGIGGDGEPDQVDVVIFALAERRKR